jgi:hypothetical protein
MADIDVVPKKHSGSAWLWIALVVVALLVVWMLMGRSSTRANTRAVTTDHPVAAATAPASLSTAA